jgi:hypothetical protein
LLELVTERIPAILRRPDFCGEPVPTSRKNALRGPAGSRAKESGSRAEE